MKSILRYSLICFLFLIPATLSAQSKVLLEWKFDKPESFAGWGKNHIETKIENGSLHVAMTGKDPFLVSPMFKIDADRWQIIEVKVKTDSEGVGEIYYTGTNDGPYGGFESKKRNTWKTVPDGMWHVCRIYPFWENEKKIVKFRIDFPNLTTDRVGKRSAEIQSIRIIEPDEKPKQISKPEWDLKSDKNGFIPSGKIVTKQTPQGLEVVQGDTDDGFIMSPLFSSKIDDCGYLVCIEMESVGKRNKNEHEKGYVKFATNKGEFVKVPFPLTDTSVYNIDLSRNKNWAGEIQMIGLQVSDRVGSKTLVKKISISDEPQGPACIQLDEESLGLTHPSNRVGQSLPYEIRGSNVGGKVISVKLDLDLPQGLALDSQAEKNEPFEVEPGTRFKKVIHFKATKPVKGPITIRLLDTKTNRVSAQATANLAIKPSLKLPKAQYVPEPKPVKSEFDIGALYYPGWEHRRAWDRIEPVAPIRKPMLGWYDEANVECIDWQIKWCVENGINTMYVDWYSNRGNRHHEHWINGFKKARYRKYMKYAIMWANHNGPDAHSYEDQKSVTEFWCKNLFNDEQYEFIDGRPVVWIWSPTEMDQGVAKIEQKKGNTLKKGEGVKRLLDISQIVAKANGYKDGIYFITMKWPEESTKAEDIQWLADAGFDMTSIYHFMSHGGKAKNPHDFDFQLVADASLPWWRARHQTGILPFIPNLSTGWDDRPWNNRTVIRNRSPELFRKILEDYKTFAKETGIKKLVLAPVNEWGEGSYIEPNREFGFSMYEQIREVLCEKPEQGWPLNYAPIDVGLGPYDLPEQIPNRRTDWDFSTGDQGWRAFMGTTQPKINNNRFCFQTTTRDPAMSTTLDRISTKKYSKIIVRMKVQPAPSSNDWAQLFWATASRPIGEANSVSVPLKKDTEFHDYILPVGENKLWKGILTELRFDPINSVDKAIEIESIRME